jgi:hypothetical protein
MTAYIPTRRGRPSIPAAPSANGVAQAVSTSTPSIVERAAAILARHTPPVGSNDSVPAIVEAVRSNLPWRQSAAVAAGRGTSLVIKVENDEDYPVDLTFNVSDFISDQGNRIPGSMVTVTPRTQTVSPKTRAKIDIAIAVPSQTPSGCYSGLVQADGVPDVKAVLSVEVL